jgi:hypothetical protein
MPLIVVTPLILLLVFLLLGMIFIAYFTGDAQIKRALRNAPRLPISTLGDGQRGKAIGRLRYCSEPLRAPLSGRACAYYEVIVEQHRQSKGSGRWATLIREVRGQDFLIVDDTGKALIKADSAQIVVEKDSHKSSGTFNDATPELEAFLQRHGVKSTGVLGFNKSLRYREGVLEEGEPIAAFGHAIREADPDPDAGFAGYREQPTRAVFQATDASPLFVSDDPALDK